MLHHHSPPLRPHIDHQTRTKEKAQACEDDVDRNRIIVKDFMVCCIDGWLEEVYEAGKCDDAAVDAAEGGEAEDFGCVVAGRFIRSWCGLVVVLVYLRHCRIVEWSEENEENDVAVASPQEW